MDQAIEAQVFLLTNFANLLSKTPSVSFGYNQIIFLKELNQLLYHLKIQVFHY